MAGFKRTVLTLAAVAAATVAAGSGAEAQSDRFQVHGYLTQGYGTSSDLSIFGVPTSGTAEYRTAALQFRYAITDNDGAVLQFRHRKLGQSALTAEAGTVDLDWAFYQRRFGQGSLKVGRVPVPAGLLNETRDVGTIMPFYRAPGNFYMEGVDALDGASGAYEFFVGDWSLETTASIGEVNMLYPTPTAEGLVITDVKLDRFTVGEVWLRTPIDGVRVGASAGRWDAEEDGQPTPTITRGSFEAIRPRYTVRSEYQNVDLGPQTMKMYYAQGSLRFGRMAVNGQADIAEMGTDTPVGRFEYESGRDLALGLSWAHLPNLVYKIEAHRATGYNFDSFQDPTGPKGETNYFIGSVSVSF